MTEEQKDRLFEQMAKDYAEQYGAQVKAEADQLEQEGVRYVSPKLDRRLKQEMERDKRRRYSRGIALLAACVALMILLPRFLQQGEMPPVSASEASASSTASSGPESSAPGTPQVIPLSFTLPTTLTVTDAEEDNGLSIYYLEDERRDHIVMTLEKAELDSAYLELTPLNLSGTTVYTMAGPDYQLLAFQQEDIAYVMTCKHDLNTLIDLSYHIV